MIPGSREKSHGKEKGSATWDISEAVLQRGTVPRASGIAALAKRVCLSQMRLPSWIPAVQRAVSVRLVPPPDLGNGRDGAAQDPYAVDTVVFGILFCESGQAGHFRCAAGGDAWGLPTKPPGPCSGVFALPWASGMKPISCAGSSNLTMHTLEAQQQGRSGVGAQKRRRFSWHCPWMNRTIPVF